MKKMKKILAFVMAMAMVLGMSVTSFAEDLANGATATGTAADKGKIVVNGIEEPSRTDVKAYMIMPAIYSEGDGKFVGYDQSLITDLTDKLTDTTLKALLNNNFAEKLDQIYTEKVTNAEEGDKLEEITLDYVPATKTYEKSGLGVGMYMIVIPSTDSVTYSKAVASIFYTNGGSNYIFNNADLTLSTKKVDGETWVKKDVDVKIEKTVEDKTVNTANVGDTLNFKVSIPNVPNYTGLYPWLKVTDTMSKGLAYQNDVKIEVIDKDTKARTPITDAIKNAGGITPTAVSDGKAETILTINFVKTTGTTGNETYEYLLKDYEGDTIEISYTAKLTEDAQRNGKDNGNTAQLDYTRDSSKNYGEDGTEPEDPPKSTTHTYTFDINGQADAVDNLTTSIITKYGEEVTNENVKKALEGATFTLYTNTGDDALVKGSEDPNETEEAFRNRIYQLNQIYKNYNADGSENFSGTTVSDANGKIKITGLAAGTYYLRETGAPTGYSVNEHVFKIEIIADPDTTTGELKTWSIKIDDKEVATFSVSNTGVTQTKVEEVAIQNMKLSSLPSTGGIGTTIFTIGGCAIMILAAGLYFASRRKSAK